MTPKEWAPAPYLAHTRRRKRAQGLCGETGCDVYSGEYFRCPAHREANAKVTAKYRVRLAQRERIEGLKRAAGD